ncbi:uncharacterized protein LOC112588291 [Harpegnathos saltator]|uniref:uncharacterized protein LOC112588291 n=1 Tax=Harpegnathos saltator TaxID=610380 RepID=UPI000DBEEAE8|nr:uncharacterized protein LOC112588291 [Harpegnathos saltator]
MRKAAGLGGVQLQIEVSAEHEWRQLLERAGLVVVDVYSDWSGPCAAMVSTLRKIKMEMGDDAVDYAVARNDDINDLARFRGRSEPVWMFLRDGKMVNLMFGAHCPRLRKLLLEEIRRMRQAEAPKWRLDVGERAPEEEVRWQKREAIRKALEEKKRAKEEAERREKYERFMAHMVLELCEETALVLYPWVFKDENDRPRDKLLSPPYMELVQDLFRQCYDVQEELRLELNEDTIERLLVESGVDVTDELIKDWPVRYPYEDSDASIKQPTRAIDDAENYLISIITTQPPPLLSTITGVPVTGPTYDAPSYIERHVHVHEPDPAVEGDVRRVHPAVWVPPQARSKVHVFKTLFSAYVEKSHPYVEPAAPLPLCAFKFEASKFSVVRDAYESRGDAVVYFGAFEFDQPPHARRLASSPDDFDKKVRHKTGAEVFVLIVRRINEEIFLAFAGIEPFFVTEIEDVAQRMIMEYFPEGAEDVIPLSPTEEEAFYEKEEEVYEEGEETEELEGDVDY